MGCTSTRMDHKNGFLVTEVWLQRVVTGEGPREHVGFHILEECACLYTEEKRSIK